MTDPLEAARARLRAYINTRRALRQVAPELDDIEMLLESHQIDPARISSQVHAVRQAVAACGREWPFTMTLFRFCGQDVTHEAFDAEVARLNSDPATCWHEYAAHQIVDGALNYKCRTCGKISKEPK